MGLLDVARTLKHELFVRTKPARRHLSERVAAANEHWRPGSRTVLMTPPKMGFGNHLYMWLWAHARRREGRDAVVTLDPKMAPWLQVFPELAALTVDRSSVRWWDKRVVLWGQQYGQDWSLAQMDAFIAECLRPDLPPAPAADATEVVVSVRRGDFYSNPTFRPLYGFNIAGYLDRALEAQMQMGPVHRIHVVSDDPQWCEDNLSLDAHGATVTYAPSGQPVEHFRRLATAGRLVLSNSTFAYWGAYIAVQGGADPSKIVAPWFHSRADYGGRAYQLDPRWTVIEEVPGGWAERL